MLPIQRHARHEDLLLMQHAVRASDQCTHNQRQVCIEGFHAYAPSRILRPGKGLQLSKCAGDVQVIGEVRGGLEGLFAKGRWAELGITEQVDSGKYKLTY